MSRITLLRHAESEWNVARRLQGHGDPDVTEVGRAQARAAAAQLASGSFDCIVTSDLRRAVQTAQILAERLGLTPEPDACWRERDIGTWTGLTREEIEARWPEEYAHFRSHDEGARPGGGESNAMLRARARAALAALRARCAGARVLVVTHRGVARMLVPAHPLGNAEWCQVPVST